MKTHAGLPCLTDGYVFSGIRVENLRALRMNALLPLRRMMLVVGPNGVGKSTLARVFPLLKQSVGSRKREPILWWVPNEVDFGSFDDALRMGSDEIHLTFGFASDREWQANVSLARGNESSVIRRIGLEESDTFRLQIEFDDLGSVARAEGQLGLQSFNESSPGFTFPFAPIDSINFFGIPGDAAYYIYNHQLPFAEGVADRILALLPPSWEDAHSQIADEVAPNIWHHLEDEPNQFENWLKSEVRHLEGPKVSADDLDAWHMSEQEIFWLQLNSFCTLAVYQFVLAEALLSEFAKRTSYLGPFRAMPERTYRHQAVDVQTLDSRGANLAMFIAALNSKERASLNRFLSRWLQFEVIARRAGAQYEVMIKLDGQRYNLLDVGFGYSQVLPVAVQLWAGGKVLSTSRSKQSLAAIVIEQPELHLHPHHQTLVARAMAASAMEDNGPMQLIETHSDHLVSEIGLLVARGQLDPERVSVLCVEPHPDGAGSHVRVATFDEDGVLDNWPAGFLSP